jgi:hypothetical protein
MAAVSSLLTGSSCLFFSLVGVVTRTHVDSHEEQFVKTVKISTRGSSQLGGRNEGVVNLLTL